MVVALGRCETAGLRSACAHSCAPPLFLQVGRIITAARFYALAAVVVLCQAVGLLLRKVRCTPGSLASRSLPRRGLGKHIPAAVRRACATNQSRLAAPHPSPQESLEHLNTPALLAFCHQLPLLGALWGLSQHGDVDLRSISAAHVQVGVGRRSR